MLSRLDRGLMIIERATAWLGGFVIFFLMFLVTAEVVLRSVANDPQQPRSEPRRVPQPRQGTERAEKRLLGDLFRLVRTPGDGERARRDGRSRPPVTIWRVEASIQTALGSGISAGTPLRVEGEGEDSIFGMIDELSRLEDETAEPHAGAGERAEHLRQF